MCIVMVPQCVVGMAGRGKRSSATGAGRRRGCGAGGAAGAASGAIQVPVVCIGAAEHAWIMMFMLYFSLRKRKSWNEYDLYIWNEYDFYMRWLESERPSSQYWMRRPTIQYMTIFQKIVMIIRLKKDLSWEIIHFGAFSKLLDIVAANSESLLFFE